MLRAARASAGLAQRGFAASQMMPAIATQQRLLGGGGVPSEWGQPKTGGTTFLGTPQNYAELTKKRPLSPDVLGVDGGPHYKFPPVALSSITNRVTGCILSGATIAGGCIHLVGDLPAFIEAFKGAAPVLVLPLKFGLTFPLVYHTFGGVRHLARHRPLPSPMGPVALVWDLTLKGIDNDSADLSSKVIFASSVVASAAISAL